MEVGLSTKPPAKACSKCSIDKPLTEYYPKKTAKRGYTAACKSCHIKDVLSRYKASPKQLNKSKWQKENQPKYEKDKKRNQSAKRRAYKKAYNTAYRAKNKEKCLAHRLVVKALREEVLSREPCEKCGDKKSEAHHDDYSKPLTVRWLCTHHHKEHHAIEDATAKNKKPSTASTVWATSINPE